MEYTELSGVIKLDFTKKLKEMIREGDYDFIGVDLDERDFSFAGETEKEVKIHLFSFSKNVDSAEAISEIRNWGFKPITVVELLAIGAQMPDLQKDWDIIALGSDIFGEKVPVLLREISLADPGDPRRVVALANRRKIWNTRCRFPAIRTPC